MADPGRARALARQHKIAEIDEQGARLVAAAMGAEGDLVATRLARDCRCFAAWIDDAVAGYGWLSTGPEWIGELQLEIAPKPGEGYIWNCVTMPDHRRKGIFRSMLMAISDIAHQGGLTRLWIGSLAIPAERVLGPAGFVPAMRFRSVELVGWRWTRVQPVPGEALSAQACEVLSVAPGLSIRRSRPRRH